MDERLFFTSTERNNSYIGEVISKFLPCRGSVLEIASGSGQHGVTFQKKFPEIIWQTSDPEISHRRSIRAWIEHEKLTHKMPHPIDLDVEKRPWPIKAKIKATLKCIVCINMTHISPWGCTEALIEESGSILKTDQILMLYGPFKINGDFTSKSNYLFEQSLKQQNINWGIREVEEVIDIAVINGFKKQDVLKMPANNLSIILRMM